MNKTNVWAHRGASAYAPENTLSAFEQAVNMKADGIELDVQLTKDGTIVVIHDETLHRVSGASGWVKDYDYDELRKINVNKHFPEYGIQHIPTLEEVYRLMKPTNLTINVELKTGVVFYQGLEESTLELKEKMGMQERVIYSSFNHYTIQKIHRLNPSAQTGILYQDGWIGAAAYAENVVHSDALHPALYNVQYPDFFEECRKHQLKVHVWTVNEEKYMRMLCDYQADAIITNDPKLARAVVDRM